MPGDRRAGGVPVDRARCAHAYGEPGDRLPAQLRTTEPIGEDDIAIRRDGLTANVLNRDHDVGRVALSDRAGPRDAGDGNVSPRWGRGPRARDPPPRTPRH